MLKRIKTALIAHISPSCEVSEQFRNIRTNLHFSSDEHKDRTFVITSPGSNEGKSTTSANLAISFAQKGDKVLLIDADLRSPSIHTSFGLANTVGVSDVLQDKTTLQNAVQSTEIENLAVLTSGLPPSNPAELLGSPALEGFIQTALQHYDLLLFDSSPVVEVIDARILAHQCDGVLLVLCSGKTQSEKAVEAKRLLEIARVKIKGLIMNHFS